MKICFTKISATGNDFIAIDNRKLGLSEKNVPLFRQICRRRLGVGADGVLLLEQSRDFDFKLRHFNADGSETECGNGSCAAAFFARTLGLHTGRCHFEFGANLYHADVTDNKVRVQMPGPQDSDLAPNVLEESWMEEGGVINTGVPHYVLFCQNLQSHDIQEIGPKYRFHTRFKPDGVNVNLVELVGQGRIALRTYERGVEDETLACGTGAVAAAILSNRLKAVAFPLQVDTQGGRLVVEHAHNDLFYLTGEVQPIYQGSLED